jgi:hypothetical protein
MRVATRMVLGEGVYVIPDSSQRHERGDAGVPADGVNLVGEPGQVHVGREPERRPERSEEVVVMAGDNCRWVEASKDTGPVVLGEASAGDSGQEDVYTAA